MKGKGASNRPSIEVSNLFGLVAGIAEELNRLVGGSRLSSSGVFKIS